MSRWLPGASLLRSRAARVAIGTIAGLLILQMVTSVAGALLATRQFENAAVDTFEYVGELTAERVSRYAEAARDVAESTVVELELLGADHDRDTLEQSLFQRLVREPAVRAVYVGWPDGEFMVLRRDEAGYHSEHGGGMYGRQVTVRDLDENFALQSESVAESDYDPRGRPWYVTGSGSMSTRWTQPYLDFFTSTTLASAAHAARVDGDGDVTAVVGADLDVDELAEVLDALPFGEGAQAFVLTRSLEVIAAPSRFRDELDDVAASNGAVPRARDIGLDIGATLLGAGEARFSRDVDRIVLDRGFAEDQSLPWRLHLIASDNELSAGLGRLPGLMWWITAASLVLVLVAAAVVWRISHPLDRMRQRAMTDPLTGLLNRHEFFRRAQTVARRAAERRDTIMVTVLDLDEFKRLNDTLGHSAGDRALSAVATGMSGSARNGDLSARMGGDEFAMLHVLRVGDVPEGVAQRVRDAVEREIHTRVGGSEHVGVTVGFATSRAQVLDLERLLNDADQALVAGKRIQKGRVYAADLSVEAAGPRASFGAERAT